MKGMNQMSKSQSFDLYLSRAEKAVKGVATNYRKAAHIALREFDKSGNLSLCQRILDSMNHTARRGVVKRSGYLTWLITFAPITLDPEDQKKLVKDKSKDAVEMNIEGAFKTDFWTLSANNDEEVIFNGEAVMLEVNKVLKRFSRDTYKADDATGDLALTNLKAFVTKHAPELVL
jgi:hypothetical protein